MYYQLETNGALKITNIELDNGEIHFQGLINDLINETKEYERF